MFGLVDLSMVRLDSLVSRGRQDSVQCYCDCFISGCRLTPDADILLTINHNFSQKENQLLLPKKATNFAPKKSTNLAPKKSTNLAPKKSTLSLPNYHILFP